MIVPTYNEPPLASFLDRLVTVIAPIGGEVLVVDDSGPSVHDLLRAEAAVERPVQVRVIAGEHRGKGAAVRRAIAESRSDIVFYIDADTDDERMAHIPEFVRLIEGANFDVVIAERGWKGRSPLRAFFSIALHLLQRLLIFRSERFLDTQCGFKAFRRDVALRMASLQTLDRGLYDVEYLAIAMTHRFRVARVPVAQAPVLRPTRTPAIWLLPLHLLDLLRVKRNLMQGRYSA